MNSRSQGNIARTISKINLQPQHLDVISSNEISKGNLFMKQNVRNKVSETVQAGGALVFKSKETINILEQFWL